ncbi:hypothetical protein ACJX0J_023049 [Zea mays]
MGMSLKKGMGLSALRAFYLIQRSLFLLNICGQKGDKYGDWMLAWFHIMIDLITTFSHQIPNHVMIELTDSQHFRNKARNAVFSKKKDVYPALQIHFHLLPFAAPSATFILSNIIIWKKKEVGIQEEI